jgi:hypothetical protein
VKLPWKRQAILTYSRPVSTNQLELEAAKQILGEIFCIRPTEVDDMILRRLEERNSHEESEEGPWPATFSLGG